MGTYRELITQAAMVNGIVGQGVSLEGQQADDALYLLRALIDRWNATDTMLFTQEIVTKQLTAGQQVYTVGPGANIDLTQRPTKLQAAFLRDTSNSPNIDRKMWILGPTEWGSVISKGVTSTIPYYVYYDANWPTANLYVWPTPSASYTIVLHFFKPLDSFISLDDTENLPPAYRAALYWNLALWLAPQYGFEPSQITVQQAAASLLAIEQSSFQPERMNFDLDSLGVYQIGSDSFRNR